MTMDDVYDTLDTYYDDITEELYPKWHQWNTVTGKEFYSHTYAREKIFPNRKYSFAYGISAICQIKPEYECAIESSYYRVYFITPYSDEDSSFIAIITNKEVIDVTNHVVEQLEAYAEGEI